MMTMLRASSVWTSSITMLMSMEVWSEQICLHLLSYQFNSNNLTRTMEAFSAESDPGSIAVVVTILNQSTNRLNCPILEIVSKLSMLRNSYHLSQLMSPCKKVLRTWGTPNYSQLQKTKLMRFSWIQNETLRALATMAQLLIKSPEINPI